MKHQLTEILDLPGVIVKEQKIFNQTIILEVEKHDKTARCPVCNCVSRRLHQNHFSLIKDLPWGEKEVFLRINRRQFKCTNCRKPFSESLDFVEKRQKYTKRYALTIIEKVIKSDLRNVAIQNNLTESKVESMINYVAQLTLPISLKSLKRLGIDEISLVKGKGKFIVVLVDLDSGKLIGMVKEKKSKAIKNILTSWGHPILQQIEEVSMDLCQQYKNLFKKLCPQAAITVDRFHVTKILHEELNQGRINQKKTAESLEIKPRQKLFSSLKGCKYILLKREESLKPEQKQRLSLLKEASASIKIMHDLKEEFTSIFDQSKNLGEGTLKLADWLLKATPFLPKTVKTIKNWFGEIVGYFEQKTTNAMVEGINNRLKVLKRCAFGFKNFDNFAKRALLHWHLTDSLA
ncbi:MAG TPA: ISL3 family transposase [Cyanobacteria bacterium UBA11369]|nr:ISL3 family transposase [Cyanobacteria bacterium UBA11371]HBE53355.1 ISL3 family transposase [Cyanobacteria bacterium UBA11369]